MKCSVIILFLLFATNICKAQQQMPQALPKSVFATMQDSTTSVDIVWMLGKGGSMSMENHNVQVFSQFFEPGPAVKLPVLRAANIMWERDGREFISGDVYLTDTAACIVFTRDGHEYVNRISETGNTFFHDQISK
jgi:hypothetical protein